MQHSPSMQPSQLLTGLKLKQNTFVEIYCVWCSVIDSYRCTVCNGIFRLIMEYTHLSIEDIADFDRALSDRCDKWQYLRFIRFAGTM